MLNFKTIFENNDPQRTAKTAGFLYLMLFPLGIFGIMYVPMMLMVQGDIEASLLNILANEFTVRLSILASFAVQLVNIFLVLSLYKLLSPVNQYLATLMVVFNLLAVPIAMLNELNHIAVLIINNSDFISLTLLENPKAFSALFLELHEQGIFIAQIFWGLWLIPMGILIFKSKFLPKFLGILMIVGGFGYILDVILMFVVPETEFLFSGFTFIGELLLPLWLVIKGVNVED